jgi:hypothetical protein
MGAQLVEDPLVVVGHQHPAAEDEGVAGDKQGQNQPDLATALSETGLETTGIRSYDF